MKLEPIFIAFIIYFVYYNFKKPFNYTKGLLGSDMWCWDDGKGEQK